MLFSPNEVTKDDAEDAHKNMLASVDMQTAYLEITQLFESDECDSYLVATSRWLEEKSIPMSLLNKYIPTTIIEKIKDEAYAENMLRPTMIAKNHNSFDFLYG